MGKVLSFQLRTGDAAVQPMADFYGLPDFENLFLCNLTVRLDGQGFISLARAITESAANQSVSPSRRQELDGLVDLGLKFLGAKASGR